MESSGPENYWAELPSVVLLNIYRYLGTSDRLSASSTCINWRGSVFQLPINDTLYLNLVNFEQDASKYHFLSSSFAHKTVHLSLNFDAASPNCMDLVCDTLVSLERNAALRTLRMTCTEESMREPFFHGSDTAAQILQAYFCKTIILPLLGVLSGKNALETFSFPLIQQLMMKYQLPILDALAGSKRKHFSIRVVSIVTIPTPELFKLNLNPLDGNRSFEQLALPHPCIKPNLFNMFAQLQILSIDHDVLTDGVLSMLGKGQMNGLSQLILVAVQRNPNVSNNGWADFTSNNPNCKVRLTVIGGRALVEHNSNLCFPNTPLTHFRALYCRRIRMNMLNSIIMWNERRLEHLELVNENEDWMENIIQSANVQGGDFIDPFIYAAWRVRTLHTIKIGYLYCGYDLIGVAKLSGRLNRLEIPKSQILYSNITNLCKEISRAMGKPWAPVDDGYGPGKSRSQVLKRRMHSSFQAVVLEESC